MIFIIDTYTNCNVYQIFSVSLFMSFNCNFHTILNISVTRNSCPCFPKELSLIRVSKMIEIDGNWDNNSFELTRLMQLEMKASLELSGYLFYYLVLLIASAIEIFVIRSPTFWIFYFTNCAYYLSMEMIKYCFQIWNSFLCKKYDIIYISIFLSSFLVIFPSF